MAVFHVDDIVAYRWLSNGRIVCLACAGEDEPSSSDEIVTRDDLDNGEDVYFCDQCQKRIE